MEKHRQLPQRGACNGGRQRESLRAHGAAGISANGVVVAMTCETGAVRLFFPARWTAQGGLVPLTLAPCAGATSAHAM